MYTARFGLHKNPFNMTPDPEMLYLNASHREALAGLTYAVFAQKGFIVLTGDAGTGKTTLLARVLQKLPSSRVKTSLIFNPSLSTNEFLEMALLDFGVVAPPESKAQRLYLLQQMLLKAHADNLISVLVIDEAHMLSREVLEEIRLLGNFERADTKLLQIVLAGQTELADVLNREDMRQLKQRIAVRLSIDRLAAADVEEYVRFRWTHAGGKDFPFTAHGIAELARLSKGIPRVVNAICDNALLLAVAENRRLVDAAQVHEACADLDIIRNPQSRVPISAPAPPVVAAALPRQPVNSTTDAKAATVDISSRKADAEPALAAVATAVSPVEPVAVMKTLERYQPDKSKTLLSRCAGLLGFGQ